MAGLTRREPHGEAADALPSIDPGKDVELTVSDGILHIEAEPRKEEKGYVRQELRYRSCATGRCPGHCRSRKA